MSAPDDNVEISGMRAVLYLRVSTGRQAEHDLSIPDQRRQAAAFCKAKGWNTIREYVEPGASATGDRRPEFQKMMDAASARPSDFDLIVVHSFSRFFRDQFQLEFYIRRLAKNGVRLVSITQDLGDDPMSVMMRQIMALFDEYQSRENAKHTLRAMRENARQGYWNGSRPPYGYRIVDAEKRGTRTKKKIEPNPLQVDNVRLMFRLALVGEGDSGPMGMKQIADFLNRRGVRTQTGGRWGSGTVHQILTRTTYIGEHRFNEYSWRTKKAKPEDEIVTVAVPPIIDKAEFYAVQDMMRSRSPQLKAPRFVNGPTLLGGICYCADCGGAMTLRTSGKGEQYRYYTCSTSARQGKIGCKGRSIRMDDLDQLVVSYVEKKILGSERLESLLGELFRRREERASCKMERITDLKKQAANADGKLTRLYAAIENGVADLSDPNLKSRMDELKAIRDAARADVDRAESDADRRVEITPSVVRRFASEARRRMRTQDGGFRRHQVHALTQRVEVGKDEVHIIGSKTNLLRTLATAGVDCGVEIVANGVRSFVPNWLPGTGSNRRPDD